MSECAAGPAAGDGEPSCFSDPRGWPYTVPGFMDLPEHLRQAVAEAPPLSPDDPFAAFLRGWLWSDTPAVAVPVMQQSAA
jgi:hypothetical protein